MWISNFLELFRTVLPLYLFRNVLKVWWTWRWSCRMSRRWGGGQYVHWSPASVRHATSPWKNTVNTQSLRFVYSTSAELNWTGVRELELWTCMYVCVCVIFIRCDRRTSDTHTHPFNGPLSGTTRVSRYPKGKTNLDFTEAWDSEWQWYPLGHMQVCTSLQRDNHARQHPTAQFYRPDALLAAQPTASKHWRHICL